MRPVSMLSELFPRPHVILDRKDLSIPRVFVMGEATSVQIFFGLDNGVSLFSDLLCQV